MDRVRLPAQLADHPYLIEYYGTVEWYAGCFALCVAYQRVYLHGVFIVVDAGRSIRGVFDHYTGWFDGRCVTMSPGPTTSFLFLCISRAGTYLCVQRHR